MSDSKQSANEELRHALRLCMRGMCGYCRMDAEARGMSTKCVNGCEALRVAKAALDRNPVEASNRVEVSTAQMERIVRDAILSYEQLYKEAPNDDAELEIRQRCEIAQGWLLAHGFERQKVSFNKEESPNL